MQWRVVGERENKSLAKVLYCVDPSGRWHLPSLPPEMSNTTPPPAPQKRPDKGATDGGKETLTSSSWMAVLRGQRKYDCFFLPSCRRLLLPRCTLLKVQRKERWMEAWKGWNMEARKAAGQGHWLEEGVHFSLESSKGGQQAGRTDCGLHQQRC